MLAAIIAMALAGVPLKPAIALTPAEVTSQIRSIKASLKTVAHALNDAERRLVFTARAIKEHAAALRVAEVRREQLRDAISARATQLYVYGSMSEADIMAGEGIATYIDRMAYLDQMRQSERGLLEEVVALQQHADSVSAELRRVQSEASSAQRSLRARQAEMTSKLAELTRLQSYLNTTRSILRGTRTSGRGLVCPVLGPNVPLSNFGDPRPGGPHQGNDIRANTGQYVRAVLPGTITDTPYGSWWGIGIVMRDVTGTEWWYAHLSSESVSPGERVAAGELIGRVGCTGTCYGSHLHFEWHPGGGSARDPYGMLSAAC